MIAAGGRSKNDSSFTFGDGAAYNPITGAWRMIADGPGLKSAKECPKCNLLAPLPLAGEPIRGRRLCQRSISNIELSHELALANSQCKAVIRSERTTRATVPSASTTTASTFLPMSSGFTGDQPSSLSTTAAGGYRRLTK